MSDEERLAARLGASRIEKHPSHREAVKSVRRRRMDESAAGSRTVLTHLLLDHLAQVEFLMAHLLADDAAALLDAEHRIASLRTMVLPAK